MHILKERYEGITDEDKSRASGYQLIKVSYMSGFSKGLMKGMTQKIKHIHTHYKLPYMVHESLEVQELIWNVYFSLAHFPS